jgi:hypothetical protein
MSEDKKTETDAAIRILSLSIAWMLMSASLCLPVGILIWIFK